MAVVRGGTRNVCPHASAAAFLDRPEIRRALRELRDADVPLGNALADLEEFRRSDAESQSLIFETRSLRLGSSASSHETGR